MKIIQSIDVLSKWRSSISNGVGFVPTMGALHDGHIQLIKQALEENRCTIVSIYVNPTQFDNVADLQAYPQQIDADVEKIKQLGVNALFLPDYSTIYPDDYRFNVNENRLSDRLCGRYREGHFDGVLTVVMKLFNLIKPDCAYFGEKDYQQMTLIRDMVNAFFMPIKVVACPTTREPDGLAMSSRNQRLTIEQRKLAPKFYQILSSDHSIGHKTQALQEAGFKVEYMELFKDRLLAAVYLGEVRLIDNVLIRNEQSKSRRTE